MFRQSLPPLLFAACALLVLGGAVACTRAVPAQGLVFAAPLIDLGERWAGEIVELEFPFEVVGSEVRIDSALPDCGCLAPKLRVDGRIVPLGTVLPPGTEGELLVAFHTAGFQGRKFTGVDLAGEGLGLPLKLKIHSWLRPWFELTPRAIDFGSVRGEQARMLEVRVRGQEPFRITSILGQAPPLVIRGVPSGEARLEQVLQVVLPPTTSEGSHFGVFNFGSDQEGLTFTLPVSYQVAGRLWTVPDRKLLLGQLHEGVEYFSQIEVGVREGRLELPEVELIDLPGATVRVETVVAGARYRVQLGLTPGSEHVGGEVVLLLPYTEPAGQPEVVERRIRVFGAVLRKKNDE